LEKPNRHRLVRLRDLVNLRARQRVDRRAALDQMTEEASELGLYDDPPPDYTAALK
jgi:hypothetical protein